MALAAPPAATATRPTAHALAATAAAVIRERDLRRNTVYLLPFNLWATFDGRRRCYDFRVHALLGRGRGDSPRKSWSRSGYMRASECHPTGARA